MTSDGNAAFAAAMEWNAKRLHAIDDQRPFKIYRDKRGKPMWYQRYLEAWWIVRGGSSLHRAWQAGHDHGTHMEYYRTVVMGGR